MGLDGVAGALERAAAMLRRRPGAGLHADATAVATWTGGTAVSVATPDGFHVATDMPPGLGGTGDPPSPGWLLRAGGASCAATVAAMTAAMEGIALERMEVQVSSHSDTRAMLGIAEADGTAVAATPRDFELRVRIAAPGVDAARLEALVAEALRRCPMFNALREPQDVRLAVEVGDG
jgi:uncharacterized OsmC-like protein